MWYEGKTRGVMKQMKRGRLTDYTLKGNQGERHKRNEGEEIKECNKEMEKERKKYEQWRK